MTERLEFGDARIAVGDETRFTKTVGESDIYGFAGITGDFAAPHMDEEYMRRSSFGERVAHGALLVGFMSCAGRCTYSAGRSMRQGGWDGTRSAESTTSSNTPPQRRGARLRTGPIRWGDVPDNHDRLW